MPLTRTIIVGTVGISAILGTYIVSLPDDNAVSGSSTPHNAGVHGRADMANDAGKQLAAEQPSTGAEAPKARPTASKARSNAGPSYTDDTDVGFIDEAVYLSEQEFANLSEQERVRAAEIGYGLFPDASSQWDLSLSNPSNDNMEMEASGPYANEINQRSIFEQAAADGYADDLPVNAFDDEVDAYDAQQGL